MFQDGSGGEPLYSAVVSRLRREESTPATRRTADATPREDERETRSPRGRFHAPLPPHPRDTRQRHAQRARASTKRNPNRARSKRLHPRPPPLDAEGVRLVTRPNRQLKVKPNPERNGKPTLLHFPLLPTTPSLVPGDDLGERGLALEPSPSPGLCPFYGPFTRNAPKHSPSARLEPGRADRRPHRSGETNDTRPDREKRRRGANPAESRSLDISRQASRFSPIGFTFF